MANYRILFALPLLAGCTLDAQDPPSSMPEAHRAAWGEIAATEIATWRRVTSTTTPEARFLQAVAFDKKRNLVVVFGGASVSPKYVGATSVNAELNNQIWEWTPGTGKWAKRAPTGSQPEARTGATMVYDPQGQKLVMFGGRSASGADLDDTWEWDPATGAWTALTTTGAHPSGRCQHGMVY
jgi:hypothetical protein